MSKELQRAREKAKLTQKKLSQRVCISVRYLQAIEAGKSRPTVDIAQMLAIELDTTVEELFPLQQRQLRREPDNRAV